MKKRVEGPEQPLPRVAAVVVAVNAVNAAAVVVVAAAWKERESERG